MFMTKKIFSFIFALLFITIPLTTYGADYLPKDSKEGGNVVVSGDQTYRNLYVGGGSVVVNNNILGDLFVGGGSVNLLGRVEEDLFVGGGNVNISGSIGEDARIAGGNISLNGPVSGDLLMAGGTLTITEEADVLGDLWATGGTLSLNGDVLGEVKIAGGEIFINSTISGPVTVRSEKLVFGPEARVSGAVTYYGRSEAVIQEGAQVGNVEFKEWDGKKDAKGAFAFGGVFIIVKLLSLFITALILLKLFKTKVSEVIAKAFSKPWKSLGIGIVALIVTPVLSVILMVTVIGSYLGIILGLLFLLLVTTSGILSIIFTGRIVERLISKNKEASITWKTVLWGTLGSTVLTLIPVIGWLAMLILFLITFGALVRSMRKQVEV